MNSLRLLMCATILILTAGCSHGGVRRGTAMIELDETSAGQAVEIAIGERMRVTLRETASTGFRWHAETECGTLLHLEEERAVPPNDATPGASGARNWLYLGAKQGRCELRFVSARSWEKGGSGKAVAFSVRVGASE